MKTDERFQDVLHQFDPWHVLRKKCSNWELFWSAFFLHFLAFGLNTERYSASLCIQSECRKLQARIILNTNTFYAMMLEKVY